MIKEPPDGGRLIVLTAPLTESIDHAGYFIQMAMASLPIWMEGVINRKYPKWREVEYNADGSARYMPAGVRLDSSLAAVDFYRANGFAETGRGEHRLRAGGVMACVFMEKNLSGVGVQ